MIGFSLPEDASVTLVIYDLLGRRVRTLVVEATYRAGTHQLGWDGRDDGGQGVASGTYLYRIEAQKLDASERFSQTRRLLFVQ